MSTPTSSTSWKHYSFGLLVTAKGERLFLDSLFRSLNERLSWMGRGTCNFKSLAKIEQLRPRTSPKHKLVIPGQKQRLPSRDEEFALKARGFLQCGGDFVILIDDLEEDHRANALGVFNRYREALDKLLPEPMRHRVSVHFLVNMLEAYYFANSRAVNEVMGTNLDDHHGDVESIRHPKGDLKKHSYAFNEIEHGQEIVKRLDLPHILSNPETCASLRTLFGWCWRALKCPPDDLYQLQKGRYFEVTKDQIEQLPKVEE